MRTAATTIFAALLFLVPVGCDVQNPRDVGERVLGDITDEVRDAAQDRSRDETEGVLDEMRGDVLDETDAVSRDFENTLRGRE